MNTPSVSMPAPLSYQSSQKDEMNALFRKYTTNGFINENDFVAIGIQLKLGLSEFDLRNLFKQIAKAGGQADAYEAHRAMENEFQKHLNTFNNNPNANNLQTGYNQTPQQQQSGYGQPQMAYAQPGMYPPGQGGYAQPGMYPQGPGGYVQPGMYPPGQMYPNQSCYQPGSFGSQGGMIPMGAPGYNVNPMGNQMGNLMGTVLMADALSDNRGGLGVVGDIMLAQTLMGNNTRFF